MPIEYRIQKQRSVKIGADHEDSPTATSQRFDGMMLAWELTEDLKGGTTVMRERGERWLPREQGETPNAYRIRLSRSFLYNCLRDTIEKLVAKPFSKTVAVYPESLGDPMLDAIADDVDGAGTSLTELGRQLFEDMVTYGKCHVLADYSEAGDGPAPSLAQERARETRPRLMRRGPMDVIGWRERKIDGADKLTQVRVKECVWEDVGEYGSKLVEYVRVINAPALTSSGPDGAVTGGTWQLFAISDATMGNGRATPEESGTHSYPGVPLLTAYAKRIGFMVSEPPMQDLAELNLAHYQSMSDQRNILRFSRMAMLAMTGISMEEVEKPTTIAPNMAFKSVNPDAKYYYVEHSGAAIGAGRDDLKDLEERMEVLGLQPLAVRTAGSTATGKAMDESKNETTIQAWIRALERLLEEAYRSAATWIGRELPPDFRVDIFSDFGISLNGTADADVLLRARAQGELTRVTFLRELKRRDVISADVNVEEEADKAEAEVPDIAVGGPPGFGGGGFGKPKPAGHVDPGGVQPPKGPPLPPKE